MRRQAVSEFLVVPPSDRKDEIVAEKERFKSHLDESFPGYSFRMMPDSPFDDDQFQVIPILGTAGGEDSPGALSQPPERWVLDNIVQVCRRFDVGSSKRRDS